MTQNLIVCEMKELESPSIQLKTSAVDLSRPVRPNFMHLAASWRPLRKMQPFSTRRELELHLLEDVLQGVEYSHNKFNLQKVR